MTWVKTWQERNREKLEWIYWYICDETWTAYDEKGFDYFWYDQEGYNKRWFNKEWYNRAGFKTNWIHKITKTYYGPDWFDMRWYDEAWYDREGFDKMWFNKKWKHKVTKTYFDPDWFNSEWVDSRWFNRDRINKFTKCEYDLEWFDFEWYNKFWVNKEWYNRKWESIIILKSASETELQKIDKEIKLNEKELRSKENGLQDIYQKFKSVKILEIDKYQQIIENNQSRIIELNNNKNLIVDKINLERKQKFNPFKLKKQKRQIQKPAKDEELIKIDYEIVICQNRIQNLKRKIDKLNVDLNIKFNTFMNQWISDSFKFMDEYVILSENFNELSNSYKEFQKKVSKLIKEQTEIQKKIDNYNAAFISISKYL